MKDLDDRLVVSWWALRIGLGLGPIITGADKFFNKLTDWGMYLSPLPTKIVPVSTSTFMHVVGVVEIIAGLIVLSRWTRLGSLIVMLWLLGIAVNLVTTACFMTLQCVMWRSPSAHSCYGNSRRCMRVASRQSRD